FREIADTFSPEGIASFSIVARPRPRRLAKANSAEVIFVAAENLRDPVDSQYWIRTWAGPAERDGRGNLRFADLSDDADGVSCDSKLLPGFDYPQTVRGSATIRACEEKRLAGYNGTPKSGNGGVSSRAGMLPEFLERFGRRNTHDLFAVS